MFNKKKKYCVLLACFLLVSSPVSAYATGAEGAILSGGSLAGLGLTGPEVALVVAGLFGVAAAVDNADTIYTEMNNCINKAVDGLENQAAVISDWWKEAAAGAIDTTSSVWEGVCNWFTGTRDDYYNSVGTTVNYKAGDKVSYMNYQRDSSYVTASGDCTYVEFYYELGEDCYYPMGRFWVFNNKDTYLKQYFSDGSTYCRNSSYSEKYNFYFYLDTTLLTSANDWKGTLSKYLPDAYYLGRFERDFQMQTDYLMSLLVSHLDVSSVNKILTGGIDKILNDGLIDSPADVIFPDTIVLNPDAVSDNGLEQILEKVIAGEMTWTDYWEAVTSASLPAVKSGDAVYELDNEGVSEKEADLNTGGSGSSLDDYKVDLKKIFPFCIPFDIYDLLNCLCAEPEAPRISWTIPLSAVGLKDCSIEIDLKTWDSIAQIVRNMELLAFCVGLAFVTRNLIKG